MNVTADSAFAHCASVAVAPDDVRVSTPVAALYAENNVAEQRGTRVEKESESPLWKPAETNTVPDDWAVLSRSLTEMPPSIVMPAPPSL